MPNPFEWLAGRSVAISFRNTEDGEYSINIKGVETKIMVEGNEAVCPLCKRKYERLYFSFVTGNILCYRCLTPIIYLFLNRNPLIENPLVVWLNSLARLRHNLLNLAKQSSVLYDTCRRLKNATILSISCEKRA